MPLIRTRATCIVISIPTISLQPYLPKGRLASPDDARPVQQCSPTQHAGATRVPAPITYTDINASYQAAIELLSDQDPNRSTEGRRRRTKLKLRL
ncbi:hypothetical protein EVAR_23102_1 [Eumeta japonica]|uniref:Uncharacterized protein n=1 Tax=Eumeta variegata TaxID=151549 RepID=A0A4C1VL96_EUMVA|nr:hypothetical protein EVAR_23102_1 [Eumeta japonica]